MIPAEKIKEIWENFIRAESGTAEKSAWLDVFLATVLSEKTEDSVINEIISFCLPGDVFTLIGCELFADVHQICSFAGDGEDLSSLQNYLLKGRGWRSLVVLDELGVKGLSCSEELSNLLISLYPVCFRCESSSSGKNPFVSSKCLKNPGINSSVKFHSKQRSWHVHCGGKQEIGEVLKQSTGESPIQTSPSKCSASSESELLEEELTISKSNTLKIRLDPMDFDYFTSIVRSEDEFQLDRFNPDSKQFMRKLDCEKEKCPDDYLNEKVKAVLESEVSVLEFCQLTMKLLCTLCDGEESKENTNAKIAVQVLGFVLENLCCLQYGPEMSNSAHLSADSVENLKVEMSWLLYSSLSKVFRYPETTCSIIEHKTFATILMLLEDSLKKVYSEGSMEQLRSEKSSHNANAQLNPDYVYSLLNCIFLFFNSLLGTHKPDDFYISIFLEIFCIFEKCHNGSLIELVVTSLSRVCEPTENESQARHLSSGFQVLDLVGFLISKVKEVRMEIALKDGSLSEIIVTHSKRRHVRGRMHSLCRRSNLTHLNHHHKTDVFGVPGLAFNPEKEIPPCTVSVLFGKLVDLISSGNVNLNLRFHAVQVATKCGTCCCFPSYMLLDAVFSALLTEISESVKKKTFQTSCFILLERTLYPQLWGCISHLTPVSALENHSCCLSSTRRDYKSTEGNISRKSMKGRSVSPDSSSLGFTSSYEAGHSSSRDVLSQWDKLSFYKELIDSKDFKLSHQTFSHLIRIFAVVTPKVLYELLSVVIFPAFVSAKKKYLSSGCEMAKFKIFSCLSIFSCYFGKSPEFVLEFFDSGSGLLHFLDLVFLQEFTQTCCYVLEEIILVVVNKLQEDMNSHCASVNSLKSVHSNLLLLTAIDNFSERMVVNLKQIFESSKCNPHLVDIMCDQSKEYLSMERYFNGVGSEHSHDSLEDTSLKHFSSKLLSKIGILDLSTLERVLNFSFMFWKACATLILKCKLYQEIFSLTIVYKKGFLLLQMLVLYVTSCSHTEDLSSSLCIKTIEALLTIYLKYSSNDVPGNETGEAAVVEKFQSMLLNLPAYPNVRICLLCEVFIRCSTDGCRGRPAILLSKKPELPSMKVNLDGNLSGDLEAVIDEIDDEDDGGSITHADVCITADEGYDGDVEILEMEEGPSNWKSNLRIHSDSCMASLPNSSWVNIIHQYSPGRKWNMQNIIFPDLCCLALDLLGHAHNSVNKHFASPSKLCCNIQKKIEDGESVVEVEEKYIEVIIQSLRRLDSLCRENANNCILLSKRGAIKKLIQGFSFCLEKESPDLSGMQQIVLDLFTHLAQYSITAGELSLYLEFFKGKDPPVDSLISPLCQLMMSTKPQPHFIMCFPIEAESRQDHANKDLTANQKKHKSSNLFQYKQNASTTTNADNAAIAMIKKLHDEHILAGIWSVWALSALALPIDADIGWSPWTNGFSLSLWLRLGCPTSRSTPPISSSNSLTSLSGSQSEWGLIGENIKENSPCPSINLLTDNYSAWSSVGSNSPLHLFSIGNELLTLEAWTNPTTDSLILKLMRTDGKKMVILSESTVESCFSPLLWHHLAVNVKDFMQRRKSVIEVTLFIDGCKEIKVLMAFNGLLMRRAAPTCLLLGHVTNQTANCGTSWYFGNLALFRSAVFSKERAFYLMSMGPNFNHLTDCDVEKQHPNFSSVLTSSAIVAGVDWDALFEKNNGNLKLLQDHLLLSYSAQNSRYLNVYPAVVSNPGGLGVVGSLFPGQPGFRVVTVDQRASQQLPLGLQPIFLGGCPNLQMYQGLAAAVSSLGGTMVFMFLFAQIVQMGSTEDCQAKALLLLLELVHSDADMFSQFVNEDSFQLLIKVLTSSLCKSGLHILKAILDSSCDKSVLHYQSPPGKFHIVTQSNAIITQPGLLLVVIKAWRGWDNFHRNQDSKESSTIFDFAKNDIKCDNSSSNMDNLSDERRRNPESGGSFGMYLTVLLVLLRDDHPYREFNAAQLNRVGAVEALLLFCKERFILEDSTSSLSSSVCCSLVEVIRLLMGAPPEFSHIVALSDFLVLVHQASATYITHARSSFYFLLTPNPYAPSKSRRTTPVLSGIQKLNNETKFDPSLLTSKSGKGALLAQTVDPKKLNKALTNLQIKQGTEEDENYAKRVSISVLESHKEQDSAFTNHNYVAENKKKIFKDVTDFGNVEKQDYKLMTDGNLIKAGVNEKMCQCRESDFHISNKSSEPSVSMEESVDNLEFDWNLESLRWSENIRSLKPQEEKELKTSFSDLVGSVSDMSVITDGLGVDEHNESTADCKRVVPPWSKEEDPCKPLVVEGLLLLLRDTLLVLPDSMSHQVLNYIVRAEALLVMANHYDVRVRTAVVKVMAAYLHRAGDEEANRFLKSHGFYLLANQLGQYLASEELLEACISLITRCSTTLEDMVAMASPLAATPFASECLQAAAFPPLLALLPKSIHDVSMAHNIIVFLQNMYSKVPQASRFLRDGGLLETLVKTLVAQAHLQLQKSPEKIKHDVVLEDIRLFLVSIVSESVSSAGTHHMQIINDIQHMLNFMESLEKASCHYKVNCLQIIRDMQVAVLWGAIETSYSRMTSEYMQQQVGSQKSRTASSSLPSGLPSSQNDINLRPHVQASANISSSSGDVDADNSFFAVPPLGHVPSKVLGSVKEVPRDELNERFKNLLQKSVDFLVNAEPTGGCYVVSETEMNFSRFIMSLIIRGLATVMEKNLKGRISSDYNIRHGNGTLWNVFAWAAKDSIRVLAGKLLVYLLCPCQPMSQRIFVVHALSKEPNCKEILSLILQSHPQVEHKFAIFYQDLSQRSTLTGPCEELAKRVVSWGLLSTSVSSFYNPEKQYFVTTAAQPIGPDHPLWLEEVSLLQEELEKQRKSWEKQNESAQLRTVYRHEGLAKNITECALDVTRVVVDTQNLERKTFMEHTKLMYSMEVHVKIRWQQIIQQFTHERAVWFFPDSYPSSWQLDLTEGPIRIRKRLQRCHLGIDKKYFRSSHHNKLEALKTPAPLSYLFYQEKSCWPQMSSTASILIERLLTDEKIRHTCQACIVSPAVEVPGEILIGESSLYFVAEDANSQRNMWESGGYGPDGFSIVWPLEDVIGLYNRRFQLQEKALEIFLVNGKTYLIAFHSSQERDAFVAEFSRCQLPNQLPSDNLSDIVQMWREGLITNFEYLTQLNKMAGRSFNDLMQYPVFPFILSDYTSQTLDITDSKVFRNLKKPMAVQEKKNEQHYVNTYNYLKEELQDVFNSISLNQEPYHYGSHYSNSGTVLHFLVRLPPFTQMFLSYQDKNFDIPDRTFHSLQTTWRLTSTDSTTDVKELIPEFFFLPEFLLNSEGFDFGVRQSGERVHNVHLPPWCEGDARKFILIHRQALESDYVRENIHHWIDLVFGYKQTGKAAVEAINVFHPATYYGFDVESIKDPLERTAWETMIRTYGQTPRQLFRSAHPMVIQSLLAGLTSVSVPSVLPYVRGLQWGSYVGSPADPSPRVVWHHQHHSPVATLVPLLTNDVFGLAPSTSMLLSYGKSKSMSVLCSTCVLGAALVTWSHTDGIVRVKLRKEQPPWPIIRSSYLDPIWICESMPDCCQLWVGHASGKLIIYKYNFSPMKGQLEFQRSPVTLLGHSGGILDICICRAFSIAVTASQDGTAIIWDLNNLTYVRSTPDTGSPVRLVCVSDTLGDVVTVSDEVDASSVSSCIRLYTINANLIGSVIVGSGPMEVTSVCISAAPEGISVNAIVAGLANGSVRLWSTWDLTLIREITCDMLTQPIISVAYSHDSQHLYASSSSGIVVIWEGAGCKGVNKTPKFLNLTSL